MKTLVIHPEDSTTEFLAAIYEKLGNKTVIRGGITKSEVQELIESHERVIMLGHGAPYGLLNPGRFPGAGLFIVDGSMACSLKIGANNIFIWCYAEKFVQSYGLSGLCSGMFISELGEAEYWRLKGIDQGMIDQSNKQFASIVSKYINESLDSLYTRLPQEYEILAKTNSIARFNLDRLYFPV